MTKNQVEVITSVQRRRRWPISEKERIIAAALEPGAVACEVARAAGIHVSQLFRWRQQLCAAERTAPLLRANDRTLGAGRGCGDGASAGQGCSSLAQPIRITPLIEMTFTYRNDKRDPYAMFRSKNSGIVDSEGA